MSDDGPSSTSSSPQVRQADSNALPGSGKHDLIVSPLSFYPFSVLPGHSLFTVPTFHDAGG